MDLQPRDLGSLGGVASPIRDLFRINRQRWPISRFFVASSPEREAIQTRGFGRRTSVVHREAGRRDAPPLDRRR